jgi:hypothetical protein
MIEIFVGPELHRVDEGARHHALGIPARKTKQRHVPVMQIAHRWYERDRLPGCAPFGYCATDRSHRFYSLHDKKP